jgi:predicted Rossmann fold flavoprotein
MKIAIIGGGAAGFFSAIAAKENYPNAEVLIIEKSNKLLSKVKVSGGGRCNLTNSVSSTKDLSSAYPRGRKELKKAFKIFNNKDVMEWFENRGVPLVIQSDNCVFPKSQNSQNIIN